MRVSTLIACRGFVPSVGGSCEKSAYFRLRPPKNRLARQKIPAHRTKSLNCLFCKLEGYILHRQKLKYMRAAIIGNVDISELEEYTGARKGIICPVPLAELLKFPWPMIRKFMHVYGLYSFPTVELIDYLAKLIEGKNAIEIGCGMGIIGRALGIPITDSKVQEIPLIKQYYTLLGQPIIQYPTDVEKLEALEAVEKYHPDIVLGSYITHKWRDDTQSGSDWGVDTIKLINSVNI